MITWWSSILDFQTTITLYEEILESDAKVMQQWQGKKSKNYYDEIKSRRLCKQDQFFLTLVRLHLGLSELDLANRFTILKSSVSCITCTWINFIWRLLSAIQHGILLRSICHKLLKIILTPDWSSMPLNFLLN